MIKYKILKPLKKIKFRITDEEGYNYICKNKKFKNINNGKRCFIIGNGPSLNNIDLKALKNEDVITVNNINKVKDYEQLNIKYHLWSDPDYFNGKYDINETLKNFKKMFDNKEITFFVPLYARDFFNNYEFDTNRVNYFLNRVILDDKSDVLTILTEPINMFRSVVQYAVVIAIYMGYKEIYLLGCDGTNICAVIDAVLDRTSTEYHAYKDDSVKLEFKKNPLPMEYNFYAQSRAFMLWRRLGEYAKANEIILKNCTETTLIDCIDRIRLEEVINELR